MTDKAMRPIAVVIRWPDRLPIMVGTFLAPARAKDHEVDAIARREVDHFVESHLPAGVTMPEIERVAFGCVVFVPEDCEP